jgi:hypothetical protein
MQNYIEKLRGITEILLKPEDDYAELTQAINDLYFIFSSASQLKADDDQTRLDMYLPKGKAIGSTWAAMCVKELMRTKRFLRGLYFGIKAAQEKFPNTSIHILYAGTGPFATLALPMTTVFTSQEINFTFLEINPLSIDLLKNTLRAFSAENYVNDIIQCDASVYTSDKNKPIHLVLTETMQNALQKEPQVSITMNLVPQMLPEGILIPQNIKIDAVLMSPKKNFERMTNPDWQEQKYYHPIKTIFELNMATPVKNPIKKVTDSVSFPEVEVELPSGIDPDYSELSLFTNIQVFGDVDLTNWQCSLNIPKKLMSIDQRSETSNKMSFQYIISDKPGFEYKFV